ncbi:MAG: NAD-dependent epimerase/dehydratase family protein, partial [Alphaproteobacteria bacterium]|nr:NAD-dependent epimerase/dehydratase family protein [Alphaproteobacteria bacterium]
MSQKIIVTGGCGYIGSHTSVALQQSGFDVVVFDNLSNSSSDSLNGIEKITGVRPEFINVDCADASA